jgi:hypothetical protein
MMKTTLMLVDLPGTAFVPSFGIILWMPLFMLHLGYFFCLWSDNFQLCLVV